MEENTAKANGVFSRIAFLESRLEAAKEEKEAMDKELASTKEALGDSQRECDLWLSQQSKWGEDREVMLKVNRKLQGILDFVDGLVKENKEARDRDQKRRRRKAADAKRIKAKLAVSTGKAAKKKDVGRKGERTLGKSGGNSRGTEATKMHSKKGKGDRGAQAQAVAASTDAAVSKKDKKADEAAAEEEARAGPEVGNVRVAGVGVVKREDLLPEQEATTAAAPPTAAAEEEVGEMGDADALAVLREDQADEEERQRGEEARKAGAGAQRKKLDSYDMILLAEVDWQNKKEGLLSTLDYWKRKHARLLQASKKLQESSQAQIQQLVKMLATHAGNA